MEKLQQFVSEHLTDDLSRLVLNRKKWPEIDMDLAVACIESRRKLKNKVQEWYDNPELIFPVKLSAEQCSSSTTASYKAMLASHIAMDSSGKEGEWRIADLTGGLGVDSWFFSKRASAVLYNEMQETLCAASAHNFKSLGADNITISRHAVSSFTEGEMEMTPTDLLSGFRPDIVYMDPARRGEGGKKVFLIEDCTPDVLTLKEELFTICRHLLIKLSPMADISMVCGRLGQSCREVHVVASGGECKELLIWMDREWKNADYEIIAVEIHHDGTVSDFRFTASQEKQADIRILQSVSISPATNTYLYEPGKSLMKTGGFNIICKRFDLTKLGVSTHYYLTDDKIKAERLKQYGKVFRIISMQSLDKRSIKAVGQSWPKAEVTARNIPMDTDTLRKKLGVTSGDDAHIFGLKSDKEGNLLIVGQRI